jgi:ribosomal protein L22
MAKKPIDKLNQNSPSPLLAMAIKRNIPQSPLKMKFLVSLIRGAWFPDALAQLKFSPKHRSVDVTKIVKV